MELAITTGGLVLAGVVIGILSGLLGVGGGTMVIPLLRLVIGLDAVVATATSLFSILFTSVSGAVSHIRLKTAVPKLGIALGVGGALTSSLGVYLSTISPSWAIMAAAALVILYSAITMLRKAIAAPKRQRAGERRQAGEVRQKPPAPPAPALVVTRKVLLQGLLIGMFAGLAAGYVGVGGGFLMVPLMLAVFKMPMKQASGTSLVAMVILCVPGVIGHALCGHIDFIAGIALAVGTIPGAMLGARLAQRVPERGLRFAFSALLAVAAVLLVVKEAGLLG